MKTCSTCIYFGYTKENGDQVCINGDNFDYKVYRYDNGRAETCREYKEQGHESKSILQDRGTRDLAPAHSEQQLRLL